MTPRGSKLDLRSLWVDGGPTKTIQGLQKENVGGEEARQVLYEIDFRNPIKPSGTMKNVNPLCLGTSGFVRVRRST